MSVGSLEMLQKRYSALPDEIGSDLQLSHLFFGLMSDGRLRYWNPVAEAYYYLLPGETLKLMVGGKEVLSAVYAGWLFPKGEVKNGA